MGFNTKVKQTENELLEFINSKIQGGIPHSVLELILENMLLKIGNEVNNIIQSEQENQKLKQGVVTETLADRKE
jgi:hypothetical protein